MDEQIKTNLIKLFHKLPAFVLMAFISTFISFATGMLVISLLMPTVGHSHPNFVLLFALAVAVSTSLWISHNHKLYARL